MNWELFYKLFTCSLGFWGLIVLLGEGIDQCLKDKWLETIRRSTPPAYRQTVAALYSISLTMFKRFYLEPESGNSRSVWRRLNSALWLLILLATVLALFCAVGYGWMGLPGQVEYVLAMVLVGAVAGTIAIACSVALGNRGSAEHFSRRRKLLHTILWVSIAAAVVALPAVLFDWHYAEGLTKAAHSRDTLVAFARTQPVLVLSSALTSGVSVPLRLVSLGILVGAVCGVFTGLSVGGVEGAWSGVATGLWSGFISAIVGYHACVGFASVEAGKLVQTILMAGLGIAATPFIAKSARVFRPELSKWQKARFQELSAYSAHVTLLTSVLWMGALACAAFIVKRSVYSQFQAAVLSSSAVYLALNAIADSFSILETYWVLRRLERTRTLVGAIGLVVFDLLASSLIYLVIPVATRSFDVIPAILFGGPKPWLGILFWSTILTSIVFYAFLASAFVALFLVPWRALLRLSVLLKDPVRALALIGLVLSTIIAGGISMCL